MIWDEPTPTPRGVGWFRFVGIVFALLGVAVVGVARLLLEVLHVIEEIGEEW